MRQIHLYNTLNKKKELFTPINQDSVSLYSCGPTVYSTPHIGNMRAYTFVDTLVRVLNFSGYHVKNLINITDVGHLTSDSDDGDDKLQKAALKENKNAYDIAKEYENIFYRYLDELNIKKPYKFPKATEHIDEQIELISKLEKEGYTYKTSDGVYFDTSKYKEYSQLANIDINGLKEGIRVDQGEKKNKTDFALWKFSPVNEKRDMEWESPWGLGFPGWHIECSAMAAKHLGSHIDIHTGGIDHIPIHHTNEIAQSECAHGHKFVNYWMHVNFLQLLNDDNENKINDESLDKMSKSKGTAYTIDDLKDKGFDILALKFFYLSGHYRNELKFNFDILSSSQRTFSKIRDKVYEIRNKTEKMIDSDERELFISHMLNDLDTPKAISVFHSVINNNKLSNEIKLGVIQAVDDLWGLKLLSYEPEEIKTPEYIIQLAEERLEARKNQNWQASDILRNEIDKLGFIIKDLKDSYTIMKK